MTDKPRALSPSQIKMFRACQRKWAFRYVDGVPADSNRFAKLGSEVHKVLEDWLGQGVAPDIETDAGRIAAAGLKHLPPPHPDLEVEAHVKYPRADDIALHGYCDLIEPESGDEPPVITDHKTTVHFKWAKTEEDLRGDVQATVYAAAVLHVSHSDEVVLRWVYYRTRGKAASKLVQVRLSRDDVEAAMEPIDETAREIYAAREAALPAAETDYNAEECNAFGGCDYLALCDTKPMDRIRSMMAKESLANKMRRQSAEAKAKAADPINAPEGPAEPEPEPEAKAAEPEAEPKTTRRRTVRGRPKGSKNVPKENAGATGPGQTTAPATHPESAGRRPDSDFGPPGEDGSFVLMVGCIPMGPHPYVVMTFIDAMAPARKLVEKTAGVPDYRMVEYGKGPGMLAATLRQQLAENPLPANTVVLLDMETAEGRDTLHVFEAAAGHVIRRL